MRSRSAATLVLVACFAAPLASGAQSGSPLAHYCIGLGPGSCFCDCDSASDAPCGNTGIVNCGCANGTFSAGAGLDASGAVDPDSVVLVASRATPDEVGIFFQGAAFVDGGAGDAFGDGLRCAGGSTLRLEIVRVDALGSASSSVPLSLAGGAPAGELVLYQFLYRDPLLSPCGHGFNATNGYKIQW